MKLNVQCSSGRKGDERPVRFQREGQDYLVEEVLEQWHGPDAEFFKVRADDGKLYILRHGTPGEAEEWTLESVRSLGS